MISSSFRTAGLLRSVCPTKIGVPEALAASATRKAMAQMEGFKSLLSKYQNTTQPYYPRAAVQKEDDVTDYDQLSRYKEWMLAGDA